jgi:pimeloyl-ACP methyl ester carboxylesterase
MAERLDVRPWLGTIRVPTLVISGADDLVIPPIESEVLANAIPDAQLRVIPHAGHLVELEQPEAFNEGMKDWLAWGCEGSKQKEDQVELPSSRSRERSRILQQWM